MPFKKQVQKELEGMPQRSALGEKVIEYLNTKDELDNTKEELERIKNELVDLFVTEGKTSIKVNNMVVCCSHQEGFKITVKSEKE